MLTDKTYVGNIMIVLIKFTKYGDCVIKIHRNFSFDGKYIQVVELFVRHRILKKMAWMKMLNFSLEKMKKEKKTYSMI
jgi:hypothetical protein